MRNRADYSDKKICKNCFDLFGIGTAISGLLGAGTSVYNTYAQQEMNKANIQAQKEINERNIQAQKEINTQNLDYQRSITQAQWERDDNAYQRQVADLQAAGLSPLAASQGAGNSQPVSSPNLQAPVEYPAFGQAPQLDMNSTINSLMTMDKLYEQHKENQSKQDYRSSVTFARNQEILLQNDRLNADIQYRNSKLAQDNEHFLKGFQLQQDIFEFDKNIKMTQQDIDKFVARSQENYRSITSNLPDKNLPHKTFVIKNQADLEKYEIAYSSYMENFARYQKTIELGINKRSPQYSAHAESKGGSAGLTASGQGASVSGHVTGYDAESKDKNTVFDESWVSWCIKHKIYYPVPVSYLE